MFFLRQKPKGLTAEDAVLQAANGNLTVIDVREMSELAASGKAKGALHIPLMRLRDMADPQHPDFHEAFKSQKPIAIYCASGGRSSNGERILRQLGYQDVHNIGGLGHWANAGGEITRV